MVGHGHHGHHGHPLKEKLKKKIHGECPLVNFEPRSLKLVLLGPQSNLEIASLLFQRGGFSLQGIDPLLSLPQRLVLCHHFLAVLATDEDVLSLEPVHLAF